MTKSEDIPSKSDSSLHFDLSRPPEFVQCGRFIADEGWIHARRIIDSWEILMGINGTVWLAEDKRSYRLDENDVLLFRPGVVHRGLRPTARGTSFYWMHFRPSTLGAAGDPSRLVHISNWLPGLGQGRVRAVMTQLQDAVAAGHSQPLLCQYLSGLLLLELQLVAQQNPRAAGSGWFATLIEWIRIHPELPLTVRDLAEESGHHPDYLARVFRKNLGMTPLEYLHRRRLNEAQRRLVETNQSIKQIAHDLGIEDERQFSRFFRSQMSMSPSEYRRELSRVRINRI